MLSADHTSKEKERQTPCLRQGVWRQQPLGCLMALWLPWKASYAGFSQVSSVAQIIAHAFAP